MSDTENTRILPVQMTPEECATRAGRCGACAKFFRVKGVERHAGPRVVDKSQSTP